MVLQKHLSLKKVKKISTWRKIAISSWTRANDPQTYGLLKFKADEIEKLIKKYQIDYGVKLSLTQIVGKALAMTINDLPEINGIIRGQNLYQRETVDIFFQVALDRKGADLSGLVIREANDKSLKEISSLMRGEAKDIRSGNDQTFNKVKKSIKKTPSVFMNLTLGILDFILYRCNLWSSLLGVKKDPFGSAMVTNVSQFGIEHGFVPIPTISHVPLVLAVFGIKEEPAVENSQVFACKTLTIGATLDHRIVDGVYAGRFVQTLKSYLEDPVKLQQNS